MITEEKKLLMKYEKNKLELSFIFIIRIIKNGLFFVLSKTKK